MVNFQETASEYFALSGKLRCDCLDYLKEVLKEYGNRIDIDPKKVESTHVSYDGGNHPEYASTLYAEVKSIYIGLGDNVTLDIEDCDEYEADRLSTEELYDVCDYVENVLLPSLND